MSFRSTANRIALGAVVTTLALLTTPLLAEGGPGLSGAVVAVQGDSSEVTVSFDGDLSSARSSYYKDGNLVVVEVTGVALTSITPVNGSDLVESVRFDAFGSDGVKITLALSVLASQVDVVSDLLGQELSVRVTPVTSMGVDPLAVSSVVGSLENQELRGQEVGAVSGPIDLNGAALASLDYDPRNRQSLDRFGLGQIRERDTGVLEPAGDPLDHRTRASSCQPPDCVLEPARDRDASERHPARERVVCVPEPGLKK